MKSLADQLIEQLNENQDAIDRDMEDLKEYLSDVELGRYLRGKSLAETALAIAQKCAVQVVLEDALQKARNQ